MRDVLLVLAAKPNHLMKPVVKAIFKYKTLVFPLATKLVTKVPRSDYPEGSVTDPSKHAAISTSVLQNPDKVARF